HVGRRPDDRSTFESGSGDCWARQAAIRAIARNRLRQTEVEHLDVDFAGHVWRRVYARRGGPRARADEGPRALKNDVRGLQVAVGDAFRVSGFECLGDLPADLQSL